MRTRFSLATMTFLLSGTLFASTASIGLATANGSFQANSAAVAGNATLFEGSLIETGNVPSRLRLNNGAQVLLGKESRARVYQSRVVLEQGGGQVSAAAYPVEARSLRIAAGSPGTVARVNLESGSKVVVAAVKGNVRVTNAKGMLVASVPTGLALSLDPQAGAAGPTRATGVLTKKDGKYVLVDETTGVTLELQGAGLEAHVGKRVEIMGAADPAKPGVVNVSTVKQAPEARRGGGGMSGRNIAIVGGVAAAGTLGGLAATGALFSDDGGGQTPTSR